MGKGLLYTPMRLWVKTCKSLRVKEPWRDGMMTGRGEEKWNGQGGGVQKYRTGRTGKSHILLHLRGEGSGNGILLCWVIWYREGEEVVWWTQDFHLSWGARARGQKGKSHSGLVCGVCLLHYLFWVSSSQPQLWRLDCPSPGSSLIGFVVTSAELTLWHCSKTSCNLLLLVSSAERGRQEGNGVSQTSSKELPPQPGHGEDTDVGTAVWGPRRKERGWSCI